MAPGICLACLAGCRIDAKAEFKADGSQYAEIVFEDTTDSMAALNRNYGNLKRYFIGFSRFAGEVLVEDITSAGGYLRCKVTSNMPHDEVAVKNNADTLSISMKPSPPDGADLDRLTMAAAITMPGEAIRSSIGRVRGNKVIIDGYDYLITGFTITSRRNNSTDPDTGPAASKSTTGTTTPTGTQSSHGDSSLWVWAGIGCTTLAIPTFGELTTFRSTHKKKQHAAQATNNSRPETVSAQPSDSLSSPR